jgi:hypothetical protein
MYLFVALVMLIMVVVVSPVSLSPVEPTIATVRVKHCNKFTHRKQHSQENEFHSTCKSGARGAGINCETLQQVLI